MTMEQDPIRDELGRLRSAYQARDASPECAAACRAFDPHEFGYRARQLKSLAQMLSDAGRRDLAGMRVLDFGCGTGRLLGDLLGLGADPALLCGADIMAPRLAAAAARYPGIRFVLVDGERLPFPDGCFDLVCQAVVFSSIALADLRRRLSSEMLRVLKPGGFVWWWDLFRALPEAGAAPLDPADLFPGLPVRARSISWLPRPSEGIARRRWRIALGWFVDLFAAPPTHLAALLGPKPPSALEAPSVAQRSQS